MQRGRMGRRLSRHVALDNSQNQRGVVAGVEGHLIVAQEVEQHAEAPDVALARIRLPAA